MYKNQLQELAQRSCFNLPSYTCFREGPDHAPRFKATVNFNGEIFESPNYCTTLRQAEHAAAEVALISLSNRGPSHSLAARILDETGVYKNLLQEISQRVGAPLPQYTTFRSGLGHLPVFTGTVDLAGIIFTGEPAKNKKQAEKNAAMAAWSSLKQLAKESATSSSETENSDELEQITIARALVNYRLKENMAMANYFPKKFPMQNPRGSCPQPPLATTSKILPLICPRTPARNRSTSGTANNNPVTPPQPAAPENYGPRPQKFPAASAAPYVPIRHSRPPYHRSAPPVTIRTAIPVFSAPPLPPQPTAVHPSAGQAPPMRTAPFVSMRQVVPPYTATPVQKDLPAVLASAPQNELAVGVKETGSVSGKDLLESETLSALSPSAPEVQALAMQTAPHISVGEAVPASPIQKDLSTAAPHVSVGEAVPASPIQKDSTAATAPHEELLAGVKEMGNMTRMDLQESEASKSMERLQI